MPHERAGGVAVNSLCLTPMNPGFNSCYGLCVQTVLPIPGFSGFLLPLQQLGRVCAYIFCIDRTPWKQVSGLVMSGSYSDIVMTPLRYNNDVTAQRWAHRVKR